MLSEFNFNCSEKPNPLCTNVLARFHVSHFSYDSRRKTKLDFTVVGGNRGIENGMVP